VSNKRVLVTGGSRGIGRAIALRLAEGGWSVAIHYTEREAAARETMAALGEAASGLYQVDLSIPTNAPKLLESVLTDGPLHAVVNNAGVYRPMAFLTDDEDAFDHDFAHTFAVNFESPLRLTRAAARYFAANGGGKILNVASRVGFRGEANAALYAASKAALINLTRSLAVELAPQGIGLFGIAPGWVDTAMARDGMDDRLPEILSGIPLARMASPEDCAAAAHFLLSEEAAYLSGVTLDINGASYFH
jgi:3-oxoacyl-[acyl-carrier protein] reductase